MRRGIAGFGIGVAACAAVLFVAGRWPFERKPGAETTSPPLALEAQSPPAEGEGVPVAAPAPPAPVRSAPGSASLESLRAEMKRGLDVGTITGRDRARAAALAIVEWADPNDPIARAVLGHAEFVHEVPEVVGFRRLDFVGVVEEANRTRWFPPHEGAAFERALRAWARLSEHARLLETDHARRAFEGERAAIDRDEDLRDYVWTAVDASPFVVFWTDGTRVDRAAQKSMTPRERDEALAREAEIARPWRRALAEKAAILPQLHAEFLRRYGALGDLRDLMGEWGGRPDLPISKRSFRDGHPIPVWVFGNPTAFHHYQSSIKRDPIPTGSHGYSSARGGLVVLCEDPEADRETVLQAHLRIVANAVRVAYVRQKNEWGRPHGVSPAIANGIATSLSAASFDRQRRLTWRPYARATLASLRTARDLLARDGGRVVPVPVTALVGADLATIEWRLLDRGTAPHLAGPLARIQAAALFAFLTEHADPERRAAASRWLAAGLADGGLGGLREEFVRAFGLYKDADWDRLDVAFGAWYPKAWLDVDATTLGPKPPALEDWPAYRETD